MRRLNSKFNIDDGDESRFSLDAIKSVRSFHNINFISVEVRY